jgi:tripartite-type tricarboxylate transporter receptor subunit TctC
MRKLILGALSLLVALPAALPVWAAYPDKPVEWVVPYPAGGGSDVVARTVGEQTIVLNQGSNQITVDQQLTSGYYQLQLIAGASVYRQGLIIK